MEEPDSGAPDFDTLHFFDGHPDALPLYLRLEELLYREFPAVNKRVQKTQITFTNRHVFACVSFTRVKRKAELPDPYLVLTLGLPEAMPSPRIAVVCDAGPTTLSSPAPGTWTGSFWPGSGPPTPSRRENGKP